MPTTSQIDAALAHADANIEASLARLFELLRIKSISTDPAYRRGVRAAADWLVDDLASDGFDASARPLRPPGRVGAGPQQAGPHVLFYGHYDVQPVDPLDLWNTPPFEPRFEDRRRHASASSPAARPTTRAS